jgi:protein-L-isoaspartate(D-aspartate) O-methyltransferase
MYLVGTPHPNKHRAARRIALLTSSNRGASSFQAPGQHDVTHADETIALAGPVARRGLAIAAMALAACQPRQMTDDAIAADAQPQNVHARLRARMVREQLRARGIQDTLVLAAMARVPRHEFVPSPLQHLAYEDGPLPIGSGQTISQPYIVAYMTEAARVSAGHRVLEIGTGSGYQAAILAELAREVWTIEIVPELATRAGEVLRRLGYTNVHVRTGDGYLGWPERAPFDAIVVTAAPDHVPPALVAQLAVGGRMVIPVGADEQSMLVISKTPHGVVEQRTIPVRFVPLRRPQ